jgi:hypothetical protein
MRRGLALRFANFKWFVSAFRPDIIGTLLTQKVAISEHA